MATTARKKSPTHVIETPIEYERAPLLDEMMYSGDSLSPALQMLYSQMGLSEGTVAEVFVYKDMGDAKRSWPGVWRGLPDDYDLEKIAKVHGSGDYRVAVYVTAKGHKTKQGEITMAWLLSPADEAARLQPKMEEQEEVVSKGEVAAVVSGAIADTMRTLLPALQQQPAMDPMKMFEMSLSMAKMMQPQQSNNDPLAMMRLFLEMQSSIKQEAAPEGGASGTTTNDLILGLIDKFGGPIANIVLAGQAQQAAGLGIQQQLQNPQTTAYNPPEALPNPISEEDKLNMQIMAEQQLKAGVGYLVDQARAGNPFETYAEVAIDAVPQEALDEILSNPDPVAWLETIDPRVNDNKEWFKNMIDEIKKILSSSDEQSA